MPSGSHRGSSGSHRSGGSRSGSGGGGSFNRGGGSFNRGGGGRRPHGPRYFYFGRRRYYVSARRSSAMSILGVLIVFALFFALVGGIFWWGGSSDIEIITGDHLYYMEMISDSESNGRVRTATSVDCFKSENTDRWYITYKIQTEDGSGGVLEGYSYSVYSMSEAMAIRSVGTVLVAVSNDVVTLETDSIPLDYKNKALEDDGEYVYAIEIQAIGKVLALVGGLVVVGAIVGEVFMAFSKRAGAETPQASSSPEFSEQKTSEKYCSYCGGKINPGDRKCPNCGSSGN